MAENSDIRRSWKSVARSDADVDLLQRSITHVENLLNRLEYGSAASPQVGRSDVVTGAAFVAAESDAPNDAPPGAPSDAQRGETTSGASLPPSVRADALRVMLNAHDEANRIRAQAADSHARAVAEDERLLVEVQQLCAQLRADAISEAAARADELRIAAREEAEETKRDACKWVDEQREIAETKVRQWLDAAQQDAQEIRRAAREMADAEAARQVENVVRAAVADAAAEADSVRSLAHDTLAGVVERLSDALECLQQLTVAMGPHAPLATALAENKRRPERPDESAAVARFDADVLNDFPADEMSGEPSANSADAPATSRQAEAFFRAARR